MTISEKRLINALDCEDEALIIEGFMERYDVSHDEAVDLFNETKKWLWLASKAEELENPLFIDRPLIIIDEMWHTFILHTRQYYKFCSDHFKRLIHHQPTAPKVKKSQHQRMLTEPVKVMKEHEAKLKSQYSAIYDHLGAETLVKWYDTFASKYNPDYINSIKKY
ncbi:hypothetical protein FNH22_00700 [Fulvivirga sp. M361]|uniref:hypothetical protein n=1 Tax=Fulvivirga sp. M361 TaxID=2594266 RepID=UPI00117B6078|nr:hypothetical protein [Fulvivirga sp. M361]TRX62646.1 hypothetical protein FNH22_00700 [Fulvivirga sp. M361]